ncbi:hypothetical protein VTK26DRAFT_3544 [Humicola hyalothermophila]
MYWTRRKPRRETFPVWTLRNQAKQASEELRQAIRDQHPRPLLRRSPLFGRASEPSRVTLHQRLAVLRVFCCFLTPSATRCDRSPCPQSQLPFGTRRHGGHAGVSLKCPAATSTTQRNRIS